MLIILSHQDVAKLTQPWRLLKATFTIHLSLCSFLSHSTTNNIIHSSIFTLNPDNTQSRNEKGEILKCLWNKGHINVLWGKPRPSAFIRTAAQMRALPAFSRQKAPKITDPRRTDYMVASFYKTPPERLTRWTVPRSGRSTWQPRATSSLNHT